MTIRVRSGLKSNRVALWERHPDHPNGEAFVVADRVVDVAETPAVRERLRLGWLVRVDEPEDSAGQTTAEEAVSSGVDATPPDDLTRIGGVGKATVRRLATAGVLAFGDLVSADPVALSDVIGASAEQVSDWQKQAGELLSGTTDG